MPVGYIPARNMPVINRRATTTEKEGARAERELANPPASAEATKTFLALKTSGRFRKADARQPTTNPIVKDTLMRSTWNPVTSN